MLGFALRLRILSSAQLEKLIDDVPARLLHLVAGVETQPMFRAWMPPVTLFPLPEVETLPMTTMGPTHSKPPEMFRLPSTSMIPWPLPPELMVCVMPSAPWTADLIQTTGK